MPPKKQDKEAWGSFTPEQWTDMMRAGLPKGFVVTAKVRITSNTYAKSITPCVWQQADLLNSGIHAIQTTTTPHHCSYCGLTGHNVATCPEKHNEAAAELKAANETIVSLQRDNRSLLRSCSKDLTEDNVKDFASLGSDSRGSASSSSSRRKSMTADEKLVHDLQRLIKDPVGLQVSMDIMFRVKEPFKRDFRYLEFNCRAGDEELAAFVGFLPRKDKTTLAENTNAALLAVQQSKKKRKAQLDQDKADHKMAIIAREQELERRSLALGVTRLSSTTSTRSGTDDSLSIGCSSTALNI